MTLGGGEFSAKIPSGLARAGTAPALPFAARVDFSQKNRGGPAVTLQTARLRLRPATMADFPAYCTFVTSDRARWMGGPHKPETAWAWFCNDVAQWALLDMGGLIVTRDGRAIGQVALCDNPEFPEPELGWFLFSAADEGQGHAAEAASALRDWALGPRGLATIVAYVDPANARSRRLAERLGARLDPSAATPAAMDTLVYRWGRA